MASWAASAFDASSWRPRENSPGTAIQLARAFMDTSVADHGRHEVFLETACYDAWSRAMLRLRHLVLGLTVFAALAVGAPGALLLERFLPHRHR